MYFVHIAMGSFFTTAIWSSSSRKNASPIAHRTRCDAPPERRLIVHHSRQRPASSEPTQYTMSLLVRLGSLLNKPPLVEFLSSSVVLPELKNSTSDKAFCRTSPRGRGSLDQRRCFTTTGLHRPRRKPGSSSEGSLPSIPQSNTCLQSNSQSSPAAGGQCRCSAYYRISQLVCRPAPSKSRISDSLERAKKSSDTQVTRCVERACPLRSIAHRT